MQAPRPRFVRLENIDRKLERSSGAPVFNDQWYVVALHRRGVPATTTVGSLAWVHCDPRVDQPAKIEKR